MSNALQNLHDLEPSLEEFRAAVLEGLAGAQKTLPCKFFYDAEGSRLFERICELPEYYPTRTESRILRDHAGDIADLAGPAVRLVELGSGAGVKIRLLLHALEDPAAYIPVDISRRHLLAAASGLARDFPDLVIAPVCADYTQPFSLPADAPSGRTLGFFPGSTIGNFMPVEAERFLTGLHDLLGPGSAMVVGVDLRKDGAVLERAYDDAAGVTAAFNLNILRRINRELGGRFDLDGFTHEARWNDLDSRIEMHLVSRRDQIVPIGGERITFGAGETIHTENSYKYTVEAFTALAAQAGYASRAVWTDAGNLFSVHMLEAV
ncbi:MAG TPA: L-histidine N(alpha)-methyltransferase [Stellaceae bacterium]|nr:L-histidine N(alpha)-methyltransferase [Stellaceae bacterium]